MAGAEKEEIPMLSNTNYQPSDERAYVEPRRFSSRFRSTSMFIPTRSRHSYESNNHPLSRSGPLQHQRASLIQMSGPLYGKSDELICPTLAIQRSKSSNINSEERPFDETDRKAWLDEDLARKNENLLRSGQLGMCNDPYCTTCPAYYNFRPAQERKALASVESKFRNIISGKPEGWMRRSTSFLGSCVPDIMNPHSKVVQQWNKFFVISCLVAIFLDPLFFFVLHVQKENRCISIDRTMTTAFAIMRSITDFIYLLHILLQFRLAYVAPESSTVGAGELVDQPKKIALSYLFGYFSTDVLVVLPLPQILILLTFPNQLVSSSANFGIIVLRVMVILQYLPRSYRFLPLFAGSSASEFIFETASGRFSLNLFICALAAHVVGSCWYIFAIQRIHSCLQSACLASSFTNCKVFLDCGRGNVMLSPNWSNWVNETMSTKCFDNEEGFFNYGIYEKAVELTTIPSIVTRYLYSFFWGFQQIGTLAGDQVPSYFAGEILFTICIVGLGLFLFALLVGNMQNFLQARGRRRLETLLRHNDVEQWMRRRRLPEELRRQIRQSERYLSAATCGVNEELLLYNFGEDLQRDIRRHFFSSLKKVQIFAVMEDPVLDTILERLRQRLCIKGSKVLHHGGIVDKLSLIVRGKMVSVDADGNQGPLSEGDIFGEELLTWCLHHSLVNKDERDKWGTGKQFLSSRTVTCLTNVEVYSLRATDLKEIAALFPPFLKSPRVQGAIRYVSHHYRGLAAFHIQVAWRYRKKRLSQTKIFSSESSSVSRNRPDLFPCVKRYL